VTIAVYLYLDWPQFFAENLMVHKRWPSWSWFLLKVGVTFLENLGVYIEKHEKRFHKDIMTMENDTKEKLMSI